MPIFPLIWALMGTHVGMAEVNYQHTTKLSPNDYLLRSYDKRKPSVFDTYQTVEIGVDLGVGADCGKINVKNTLRAALGNMLNARYLGDMGRSIVAASPMLTICYFSPTWCAIVKNFRLRASMLANLRLDQCGLIDRYVDSRVEDYERERQQCVRGQIKRSGGNFEQAMESCGKNHWHADLTNWAGGSKAAENRLLQSSAQWAGFKGPEADRVVSLAKALVGDTILKRGKVSVDFGPTGKPVTPRSYVRTLQKQTFHDLCEKLMHRVEQRGGQGADMERVVTKEDLRRLSGDADENLIDRQTLLALAYLPYKKRRLACRKLADAIAMTVFTMDMSRSLDFLASRVVTNPHLPEKRQAEAERKYKALKDQIEMTLSLQQNRHEPLNKVLQQINQDGANYQDSAATRNLRMDEAQHQNQHVTANLWDCSDDILCDE